MEQVDISVCEALVEQIGKNRAWSSVAISDDYVLCAEPVESAILLMLCRADVQSSPALLREIMTRRWRAPQEFEGIQIGVVAKLGVCAILRMPTPDFSAQTCMRAADRMMLLLV